MKYHFLLLSLLCLNLNAQSPIDPGIDGKTIDRIIFEDNYIITFDTAEDVTRLRPRGLNGLIVTVDARTGEILNSATDEKGIYLKASDAKGNYLLTREGGAVINPFGSSFDGYQVIVPMDNEVGIIDVEDDTAYEDDDDNEALINGIYYIIGPKRKGFKDRQKLKADQKIEWILTKYTLKDGKEENIVFP